MKIKTIGSTDFTDVRDVQTLLKCVDISIENAESAGILTALSDLKLSLELLLEELKK